MNVTKRTDRRGKVFILVQNDEGEERWCITIKDSKEVGIGLHIYPTGGEIDTETTNIAKYDAHLWRKTKLSNI